MDQLVTCQCGKRFKLPDSAAGKRFRCKACGATITVPLPAARAEEELNPFDNPLELAVADAASAAPIPESPSPPPRAGGTIPRAGARATAQGPSPDLVERLKMLGFLAGGLVALAWFAGFPLYQLNQGVEHVRISLSGICLAAMLISFSLVALVVGGTILPWKKNGPKKPLGPSEKAAFAVVFALAIAIVAALWFYFNSRGYTLKL